MSEIKEVHEFKYELFEDLKLCQVKGAGKITTYNILDIVLEISSDKKISSDYAYLGDLRDISFNPKYDELMEIKEKMVYLKESFQNKIAVIVPVPIFVIAQMVTLFTELAGLEIKIFSRLDKAYEWLEIDQNKVDSIIIKR